MSALVQSESFFTHKDEYFALLNALVATEDEVAAKAHVKAISEILDEYQEQPLLLDRSLEASLDILMGCLRGMILGGTRTDADELVAGLAAPGADAGAGADDAAAAFPFQVHHHPTMKFVFKTVYLVCKTRGYKHVVKLFPHEVADLEPTLRLLLSQDKSDSDTWETRYVLLLWLSILVLVPFDLRTVDSSLSDLAPTEPHASDGEQRSTLVESIISTCKEYLADPGAVRDASAVCLSRLLTRPDMDSSYLRRFMAWARDQLRFDEDASVFLLTGVFTTLTHIAKHGHREVLRECLPIVFSRVVSTAGASNASPLVRKLTVKLAQRVGLTYLPPRVVSWRYQRGQRSLLDNLARSDGKTEEGDGGDGAPSAGAPAADDDHVDVPPEIEDIVEMLLTGLRDKDTVVRWSAAKGVGRVTSRLPVDFADDVVEAVLQLLCPEEGDGAWHGGCLALAELARRGLLLPARLTDVVPVVVKALTYDVRRGLHSVGAHVRDAACYVCWAFARAYAPAVMAPHVVELARGMLTVSVFDREVNCRRAASAAFQENVGRQGHENFPNGITILTAADYFTLGNRAHAYQEVAPVIAAFPTYRYALIDHAADVKLRHWDVEIRELAAKALAALVPTEPEHFATDVLRRLLPLAFSKELVTRHGATLGIAEVTNALCEAKHPIPDDVRTALRNLVPKVEKARLYRGRGGEYMRGAVCRLIECLGKSDLPLPERLVLRLLDTIDDCLKHPHDTIQFAAAAALRALARTRLATATEAIHKRLPLKHTALIANAPNPAVSRGAAMALGVLPRGMLAPAPAVLEAVVAALIQGTKLRGRVADRDAETRRNCVTAMADIVETVGIAWPPVNPAPATAPSDDAKASSGAASGGHEADGGGSEAAGGLTAAQVYRIFAALLLATRDYATDKRGDVGSWVRHHAMLALERVTRVVLRLQRGAAVAAQAAADAGSAAAGPLDDGPEFTVGDADERQSKYLVGEAAAAVELSATSGEPVEGLRGFVDVEPLFTPTMATALTCALLRQLSEKLDMLRGVAGDVLSRLLNDQEAPLVGMPQRMALKTLFKLRNEGTAGAGSVSGDAGGDAAADAAGEAEAKAGGTSGAAAGNSGEAGDAHATAKRDERVVNWTAPTQCYPVVVKVLRMTEYCDAVVEGLVTSVGGMSESVVKHSSAAFVAWAKQQKDAGNYRTLQFVAKALHKLLLPRSVATSSGVLPDAPASAASAEAAAGSGAGAGAGAGAGSKPLKRRVDARVLVPALRTMHALLEAGALEPLQEPRSKFAAELVPLVTLRVLKSVKINRIMAGLDVLVGLVGFKEPVATGAVQVVLELLCHKFPNVRKVAAEKLYVKMLIFEDSFLARGKDSDTEVDVDAALEVLTETGWDSEEATGLEGKRDALYTALCVQVPDRSKLPRPKQSGGAVRADAGQATYADLVKEMHY